jgi:co-chaperonin GroES (HSP10)
VKIRLLPGQVVVREEASPASEKLWTPSPNPRKVTTHTGRILALGPPALHHGHPVPHEYQVGDLVQFHFNHLEELLTNDWPLDGKPAIWLPQKDIDAVWEES